jgi:hypothetical protein
MARDHNIKFGTHGTIGLFPVGSKCPSTVEALEKNLGQEVEGPLGHRFRLVRLNIAAGLTAANAECRAFKYSADDGTFDVELCTETGRACGFSVEDQVALDDNDYFWLHVDGPKIKGFLGDDAGNPAAGDYVEVDDDADKGKLKTTTTTYDAKLTMGVCLEAASTDGDLFYFRPIRKLNG